MTNTGTDCKHGCEGTTDNLHIQQVFRENGIIIIV